MATRTVHRHFPLPHYGHTSGVPSKQSRGTHWRAGLAWRLRAHLALFMVLGLVLVPAWLLA